MIRKAGDGNVMTGWCNGSAGHLFLWSLAGDIFQDSYFRDLATGCGYYISDEYAEGSSTGYDLCCGDAGRAYALLNLFRSTKDQRWYDASLDATKQGILKAKVGNTSNAYDFSLFKGQIGLACVAADVLGPRGQMPAFEE
jgi:serine/threonine-protein kinase